MNEKYEVLCDTGRLLAGDTVRRRRHAGSRAHWWTVAGTRQQHGAAFTALPHQLKRYYVHGVVEDCRDRWKHFSTCMSLKLRPRDEAQVGAPTSARTVGSRGRR